MQRTHTYADAYKDILYLTENINFYIIYSSFKKIYIYTCGFSAFTGKLLGKSKFFIGAIL